MRTVIVREGSFSLLDTRPSDNSYPQAGQVSLSQKQSPIKNMRKISIKNIVQYNVLQSGASFHRHFLFDFCHQYLFFKILEVVVQVLKLTL